MKSQNIVFNEFLFLIFAEKKFHSVFTFNDPEIIFIHHKGDSTGLLAYEIQEALDSKKKKLNLMGDIFKNKTLRINQG